MLPWCDELIYGFLVVFDEDKINVGEVSFQKLNLLITVVGWKKRKNNKIGKEKAHRVIKQQWKRKSLWLSHIKILDEISL